MLAFDQKTLNVLDWPIIESQLQKNVLTPFTQISTDALFFDTAERASDCLRQVEQASIVLFQQGQLIPQTLYPINNILLRLAKSGVLQFPLELNELYLTLLNASQWVRQWLQLASQNQFKPLQSFLQQMVLPNTTLEVLAQVANETNLNFLKETASTNYQVLLQRQQQQQVSVFDKLQSIILGQRLTEPEGLITERLGRYLISVRPENRNKVKGPILDTSQSGHMLYIEPESVGQLLNQLKETQSQIQVEVQKILKNISEKIAPNCAELQHFISQVAELDILQAKAQLAKTLDAQAISFGNVIHLKQAKHPLLLINKNPNVVANTIELKEKALLISGPNAGGKTVTLKLVGLFALMLKAGIPVPCEKDSTLPWFDTIYADIGDSQSLEQNLSTFTAHLTLMKQWLEQSDLSNSLILIDEICAGTDPVEAACLAESILTQLVERQATVIASSHLNALKKLAYQHPQFQNASVLFNEQTFEPTYQLVIGASGQSHALSIAKQRGLPSEVVEKAQQLLADRQSTSDELLEQLEIQQAEFARKQLENDKLNTELKKQKKELSEQFNKLQGEKRQVLDNFKKELKEKFLPIEKQIADVKSVIKQRCNKVTPSTSRYVSRKLNQASNESTVLLENLLEQVKPEGNVAWNELNVGDSVQTKTLNLKAQVIEKHEHNQTLTLQSGLVKTIVPLSEILSLQESTQQAKALQRKKQNQQHGQKHFDGNKKPKVITRQCDVRGLQLDEALGVVEKFLDEALMDKESIVAIVHGLGTNSLKNGIRKSLASFDFIDHYYAAPAVEGGDGKTIVEL